MNEFTDMEITEQDAETVAGGVSIEYGLVAASVSSPTQLASMAAKLKLSPAQLASLVG